MIRLLAACAVAASLALAAPAPAAAAAPAAQASAEFESVDAAVEAARARFEVPGVAIAIVKDGQVVYERGFGVRELGKPGAVTPDTLFAIASNTKAFTSTALSILADEGKLSHDDRVVDHLPWFQMSDPYVTREMRLRDLLVHRSGLGLGAGDLLYWPATDYTAEEVARRLRHVPLSGGFRERYAYDNILYGVAQLVVEKVSGQGFERFLQSRILDPLGMRDTRYNADTLRPRDEVATGHAKADFTRLEAAPRMTWSNVAGAGGMYSNVRDMARWMRVQLAGGVISGEGERAKRLVSTRRHHAMWQIATPMNVPAAASVMPELAAAKPNFLGYAEGWMVSDYRGRRLVWHTGGWPGMVSRVTLVPDAGVGVVVLTNAEVGHAFNAITLGALDAALGIPRTDWVAAYGVAFDRAHGDADADWKAHLAARAAGTRPSLALERYAGTYRDPWYGDVVVERRGDGLALRFSRTKDLVGRLEHWQHDSFIVRWDQRWLNADAFVDFDLDHDGAIRQVRMEPVSPLTDFSFDFQDLRLAPVPADRR